MVGHEAIEVYEKQVQDCFPYCPFCGNNQLTMNLVSGGKDTLSCEVCNAKWHLFIGLGGLKCAILEQPSRNGEGKNLVGRRYEKNQWKKYIEKHRASIPPPKETPNKEANQIIREREIIREKEVIVKIRCPYCKTTFNETLDKCPNCGARA